MLENFVIVVGGFIILIYGADRFVTGAAATASNLGVSPLIIGLTIVGFGTSAPEILVSGLASWDGTPGLAIGNALGSNITNIAMVIGVTALVMPLNVKSETLKREYPILFAVMLIALMLLMDRQFSRLDGIILISGFFAMIYWMVSLGLRSRKTDPMQDEFEAEIPKSMPMTKAVLLFLVGLVLLLVGSRLLINGAVDIAQALGVSDLIIGLTIVAIGTSLPELAASVVSALKHEHDIAIGNVIGSNMFNLLAVLGLPGLIHPGFVPDMVLERDFPYMIGLTIMLFVMAYGFRGPGRVNRVEGGILLSAFVAFQVLLYFTEQAGLD